MRVSWFEGIFCSLGEKEHNSDYGFRTNAFMIQATVDYACFYTNLNFVSIQFVSVGMWSWQRSLIVVLLWHFLDIPSSLQYYELLMWETRLWGSWFLPHWLLLSPHTFCILMSTNLITVLTSQKSLKHWFSYSGYFIIDLYLSILQFNVMHVLIILLWPVMSFNHFSP